MKRVAFFFILILGLALFSIVAIRRYPEFITHFTSPTITPLAFLQGSIGTPVQIPTLEPTIASARSIPLPKNIPTLDYVKDFVTSTTPATLEMTNDWTAAITLDFEGLIIKIDPGRSETRQFPPGDYRYTASAPDCGSPQVNSITLEANKEYSVRFYCSSNGVFGDQPGSNYATFVVINNSNLTISLKINDRTYQVPPGTMEIRVVPGTYTYSASAPGVLGSFPETVTLSAGEQVTINFSISKFP